MPDLDQARYVEWTACAHRALSANRAELNRLNVFPVRDHDTGTNLVATWAEALDATGDSLGELAAASARAVLVGAKGNSGNVLAQLLGGFAAELRGRDRADGRVLAAALTSGARLARLAVAEPVEGTVLTVLDAAAGAARAAGGEAVDVSQAAAEGARAAVAETGTQHPVLRAAGVVDAGAAGIALVLEALHGALAGLPEPELPAAAPVPAREEAAPGPGYEVTYLLDAPEAAVDRLREALLPLGNSLVIAGGPELWSVHVHVDDVAGAIEAGIEAGRPHRLGVVRFADQATSRTLIAVADGDGVTALLEKHGVTVTTAEGLTAAIAAAKAAEVVVLADRVEAPAVVPCESVLQALVAVAVSDPGRPLADDVAAMTAAAAACRCAAVIPDAGVDPVEATVAAARRLAADGGELLTVLVGLDGPENLKEALSLALPSLEIEILDGGQRDPMVLLGLE